VCPAVGVEAAAPGKRREDVGVVDRLFGAVGGARGVAAISVTPCGSSCISTGKRGCRHVGDIHPAAVRNLPLRHVVFRLYPGLVVVRRPKAEE